MYRAPKVVNRLIDQQMREIANKKHQDALRKMKPSIDNKRPPPVPRLVVYEKHQTRDRNYQIIDEAMKIRTIQEIEQQRQSVRSSRIHTSNRASRPRLIDWTSELPPHPKTAGAQRRQVIKPTEPIPPPHYEEEPQQPLQREEFEDDGMKVVVETQPVPDIQPSPRNQTFQSSEFESDQKEQEHDFQ